MKNALRHIRAAAGWIWKQTSAGVAVLLTIAALFLGYHLGRPAPEPPAESAEETHDHEGQEEAKPRMYTCSMHPSVRLPDPDAKCPICFMDLIPVAEDDDEGEGSERRISMSREAAVSSRIETAPVARFFPTAEVRLFGRVTYDETAVARLTAYFPGRLDRLFVNFVGATVALGDHVAEVYSPDILAAFEELRQAARAHANTESASAIVRSAAEDTLKASREKLRLFGLTDAQIEAAERGAFDSDRIEIYAPIGGVVTELKVREGDYVRTGSPIATVADLSRLWIDLQAYESQLPMLRWGQSVTFTVESHPGEKFEGRIAFIEPVVNERTRTAAVRVAVDNKERRLKPGMFASAAVRTRVAKGGAVVSDELAGRWISPMHPTVVRDGPGRCDICGMELVPAESLGVVGDAGEVEEPLVIPRTAVLYTGTRSVVYIEVPDTERPTYEGRTVVLGPRAGEFYIVREGLSRGERVVVNGAFRIDSAMQIAAKPSMMSPAGDAADPHAGHAGHGVEGEPRAEERVSVPDNFVFALKPVYSAYFDAQEALAADDMGGFAQAAADLRTALSLVEEDGLVGEPLGAWRRAASRLRVDPGITDIEVARVRFERMSEAVISLQRRFGHHGSRAWVVVHCPMAFDDQGADWLQRSEQINNPYFGESMLRCGEIVETFEPLHRAESDERRQEHGGGHDHE